VPESGSKRMRQLVELLLVVLPVVRQQLVLQEQLVE
jgi:hypothetical protein